MLNSITFHNFKGFSQQSVSLGPLTLLSGMNGTGKSSVLQAIAMLRQSYEAGLLVQGAWLLNGELVQLGAGRDVAYDGGFDDLGRDIISIALTGKDTFSSASLTEQSIVVREPESDVLWEAPRGRSGPGLWSRLNSFGESFQYLRADRIVPAVAFPKAQHAVESRKFLGTRGEFSPHFLLEYGEDGIVVPEALRHAAESSSKLLSQVNAWMQEFSPSVRVGVKPVEMTDLVRLEYAFRSRGVAYGNSFRSTNVGFGLTHALPIIVACLATRPGGIVLIENPEAQLHPQGQVAIGKLLASASSIGVQVIVETHSDHILNGIRLAVKHGVLPSEEAHIHFFSRVPGEGAAIQSPRIDKNGLLSDWPKGFFTQWDETLLDLLS